MAFVGPRSVARVVGNQDITSRYGAFGLTVDTTSAVSLLQNTLGYKFRYVINATAPINLTLGKIGTQVLVGYTAIINNRNATPANTITVLDNSGSTIVVISSLATIMITAQTAGTPDIWQYVFISSAIPPVVGPVVPINLTAFVDQVYGNDGTAILNRYDKPYLTIAAAGAAALTTGLGYCIYIRPGTYSETAITLPTQFPSSIYCEAGVTWTNSGGGAFINPALIIDVFGYVDLVNIGTLSINPSETFQCNNISGTSNITVTGTMLYIRGSAIGTLNLTMDGAAIYCEGLLNYTSLVGPGGQIFGKDIIAGDLPYLAINGNFATILCSSFTCTIGGVNPAVNEGICTINAQEMQISTTGLGLTGINLFRCHTMQLVGDITTDILSQNNVWIRDNLIAATNTTTLHLNGIEDWRCDGNADAQIEILAINAVSLYFNKLGTSFPSQITSAVNGLTLNLYFTKMLGSIIITSSVNIRPTIIITGGTLLYDTIGAITPALSLTNVFASVMIDTIDCIAQAGSTLIDYNDSVVVVSQRFTTIQVNNIGSALTVSGTIPVNINGGTVFLTFENMNFDSSTVQLGSGTTITSNVVLTGRNLTATPLPGTDTINIGGLSTQVVINIDKMSTGDGLPLGTTNTVALGDVEFYSDYVTCISNRAIAIRNGAYGDTVIIKVGRLDRAFVQLGNISTATTVIVAMDDARSSGGGNVCFSSVASTATEYLKFGEMIGGMVDMSGVGFALGNMTQNCNIITGGAGSVHRIDYINNGSLAVNSGNNFYTQELTAAPSTTVNATANTWLGGTYICSGGSTLLVTNPNLFLDDVTLVGNGNTITDAAGATGVGILGSLTDNVASGVTTSIGNELTDPTVA